MPPRVKVPKEANPEIEEEEIVEETTTDESDEETGDIPAPPGPEYRTLKYLGLESDWKCYATSPPLEFSNRICAVVPRTVAEVLIKNKKPNKLPLFKDVTPGAKPLVNPETEGLPDESGDDFYKTTY